MAQKRIRGITIEIGADTKEFVDALSKIGKKLSETQTALKDINKLLKYDPTDIELLSQKHKYLAENVNELKEKYLTLIDAEQDFTEGTKEWDALQREIEDTEQKLKQAEKELRNFGSEGAQQLKVVGQKMQELGDKIAAVGATLTKKVTAPIVALGTVAVKKFADVDKTMVLTNETMKNTADEADHLWNAMEDAASHSIFTMDEAANATLNFARAGLSAEEAAYALAPAMNLAAGEGGNLDTVSHGLIATINAFHGDFADAAYYADVMAAACNNSALDIDSLSESMRIAGPVFAAAGYSVNDAALYMGIMADNGITAAEAANSLKTGFARLVAGSDTVKEQLAQLGLLTDETGNAFVNLDGTMKSTAEIQQILHDKFAELSESEQIEAASNIFGKNQMSKWLALINTAPEEVAALSAELDTCTGTTNAMSDAMMNGFGGSIERMKSSLDVLMTSLGRLAAQYITPLIEKIQAAIDKFNSLDDSQKDNIIRIAGLVAAIGPALLIIGNLIKILGTAAIAVSALSAVLGIGPLSLIGLIGGIPAAIAAGIAAGVLLYQNFDKIKEKAVALKDKITEVANSIRDSFFEKIDAIETKINWFKDRIRDAFQRIREFIKLPHFSIAGEFSLMPPSVPYLSVDWYKKAYNNPVMFKSPTVLQTPSGYKGFGDGAGAEIVMGLNKLRELAGGGQVTNNITIYQQPGESAKVLADRIIQEITYREERAAIGAL